MKARIFASVLAALIMLSALALIPVRALNSGDWLYEVIGGEAVVTMFDGVSSSVVIPSAIEGYKVTEIDIQAFYKNPFITDVTIPDGVKKIGDMAFDSCYSLKSIEIPSSVTEFGNYVFSDCSELETFEIPRNVKTISDGMFNNCRSLNCVDIPESVTKICKDAFSHCTALTTVDYSGSESDWNRIVIEDGNNVLKAATVHFRKSETKKCGDFEYDFIGDNAALTKYTGSASYVEVPAKVDGYPVSMINGAFFECKFLKSVTISSGIIWIGNGAFAGCSLLTDVDIPDTVSIITTGAFQDCTALQVITIPESVTDIGYMAFDGCTSLKTVNYTGSARDWYRISIGDYNDVLKEVELVFEYDVSVESDTGDDTARSDTTAHQTRPKDTDSETQRTKDYDEYKTVRTVLIVLAVFGAAILSAIIVLIVVIAKKKKST